MVFLFSLPTNFIPGGTLLERLVKAYDSEYKKQEFYKCGNIVQFLAQMYNLGIITAGLIYDLIRLLVNSFKEEDIELLLTLLTSSSSLSFFLL